MDIALLSVIIINCIQLLIQITSKIKKSKCCNTIEIEMRDSIDKKNDTNI